MLAKNRFAQVLAYTLGALLVWAMVGCGGSGGASGVAGGAVALKIAWPKPSSSRYIPPYAHSLSFSLYSLDNNSDPLSIVVNRPDTLPVVQTVTFAGPIPPGHYILGGLAKVGFNGLGDSVASASSLVLVQPTGTTTVALTLASTLYSLDLQDVPVSMSVGDSKQLVVKVLDKNNNQLFLPNGALSWSLLFGSSSLSLSDAGFISALATGQARVRVSEVGAGLYSDGDVNVSAAAGIHHQSRVNFTHP